MDKKDKPFAAIATGILAGTFGPETVSHVMDTLDDNRASKLYDILKEYPSLRFIKGSPSFFSPRNKVIVASGPHGLAHELGHMYYWHNSINPGFFKKLKEEFQASTHGLQILRNVFGRREMLKAIPSYLAWGSTYARPITISTGALAGALAARKYIRENNNG